MTTSTTWTRPRACVTFLMCPSLTSDLWHHHPSACVQKSLPEEERNNSFFFLHFLWKNTNYTTLKANERFYFWIPVYYKKMLFLLCIRWSFCNVGFPYVLNLEPSLHGYRYWGLTQSVSVLNSLNLSGQMPPLCETAMCVRNRISSTCVWWSHGTNVQKQLAVSRHTRMHTSDTRTQTADTHTQAVIDLYTLASVHTHTHTFGTAVRAQTYTDRAQLIKYALSSCI